LPVTWSSQHSLASSWRQPLLVVQRREQAGLLLGHLDPQAPRVELLERRHRPVAPVVLGRHRARPGLAAHRGVARHEDDLLVRMLLLVLIRQQDDRVVGVVGLEARPRVAHVERAAVEAEDAAVERDAGPQLLQRRLPLRVVEEAHGVPGRVPDAVGRRPPPVEFLEHRKRDHYGVVRGEILERVWSGNEDAGVDDVGLAWGSCVR
jgi:hypothetical protein